jgi:hypothetical protein
MNWNWKGEIAGSLDIGKLVAIFAAQKARKITFHVSHLIRCSKMFRA